MDEFLSNRIGDLFRNGRTLIGIGIAYEEDSGAPSGGIWTVRSPAIATLPRPAPAYARAEPFP